MSRESDGYTPFPNYFIDRVMRKAGGVEWKVICTVIRDTLGWQDNEAPGRRRQEAEIPIERFEEMTGAKRSRLFEAITAACQRGAVKRPQQRAFRFRPDTKANLQEVPKKDRRRREQPALPGLEKSENRTLQNPITGLEKSENRTEGDPVLRSVKESFKETHTPEFAGAPNVCVNEPIDRQRYKAYARAHAAIFDPNGWATKAERTRYWDADVLEWEAEQRANQAAWEAELTRQRRESLEWHDRPAAQDVTTATAAPAIAETDEQRHLREVHEARERAAAERGQQILSECNERVRRRKLGTG